jgi:hypothetical protein
MTGPEWGEVPISALRLAAAACTGALSQPLLARLLGRIARRTRTDWDDIVLGAFAPPARVGLPLLAVQLALPWTIWSSGSATMDHVLQLAWIATTAWAALRLLRGSEEHFLRKVSEAGSDNLGQRRIATQVRILRQILSVTAVFVAVSLGLMSFDQARRLATGLLATAGIAGVVVGLSAQKTLGNPGVQIALTQPIRLDDVVVVEGEWGRVEEISLTYVVVRIWDGRALVLPIGYFLEKPFQNWTRSSAEILGTVSVWADPSVPVPPVRAHLEGFVKAHPLWDGRVCGLQVVDADPRAVELRALVSASDSGRCWDLRCAVREEMLAHISREHPGGLPRARYQRVDDPAPKPTGPA